VATQDELLALHGYVLASVNALAEAEKRLLTALGHATSLADDERGRHARDVLVDQVAALRGVTERLSGWLDDPSGTDGGP
jgi:hypothetical protein